MAVYHRGMLSWAVSRLLVLVCTTSVNYVCSLLLCLFTFLLLFILFSCLVSVQTVCLVGGGRVCVCVSCVGLSSSVAVIGAASWCSGQVVWGCFSVTVPGHSTGSLSGGRGCYRSRMSG